jgi:F1F0 ATPase subunit 2
MNETLSMILAFFAGIALGILFFGVLWLTVKKSVTAKAPWLWVLGSFFLRVSITLLGFYFVGAGNWQRLLICLGGFIIARFLVIHFTKSIDKKNIQLRKEAVHGA